METLLAALGPALAAGLAVQRLLEILDGPIDHLVKLAWWEKSAAGRKALKRLANNLVAVGIGFWLAFTLDLDILAALGADTDSAGAGWLDGAVTGLIVSTGTEGVNSIVKFLGYKKEEKKVQAAKAKAGSGSEGAGGDGQEMDRTVG